MVTQTPLVSVVIPNWNGKRFLSECLQAMREQSHRNLEVILVDNGSTDGSVEFVRSEFPEVKLVSHPKNLGFAEGTNSGIRVARGDWIATLNNDTKADPEWLTESLKAATCRDKVGMIAARLVFRSDPRKMNSAGIKFGINGRAWDIGFGELYGGDFTRPLEVFGPTSGAALYSSDMLREVGLFDSSFFAYFEDLDLAWRARLRGWLCVYCPTAVVQHHFSGTSKPLSPFVLYQCQRNRVTVMIRYFPIRHLMLSLPIIAGEFAGGFVQKVKEGSSPSYNGLLSGFGLCWDSIKKRRTTFAVATVSPWRLMNRFAKRRKYYDLQTGRGTEFPGKDEIPPKT